MRPQLNPQRIRHRVALQLRFGNLQRPRRVMNLAANELTAAVGRVQTIALGQEMLERSRLRGKWLTCGAIAPRQHRAVGIAMGTFTLVLNPIASFLARHSGPEIRQMKPHSRDCDSERIPRIQTEKPYPRLSVCSHIGSHV